MNLLSSVYGAAATWRRRWYAADPARVRALARPVVSIGNISSGGSGKTPLVAFLAEWLVARGERPAILSRGYGRERPANGVTVVSDGNAILADLAASGDEPLMLARALPSVPVVVAADRFLAGTLAERQLGATIHLLDDGFQHLGLKRDIDLLLVDPRDLDDRVLPAGRLREPLANAARASAILVPTDDPAGVGSVAQRLGVPQAFAVARALGPPRRVGGAGETLQPGAPVFAVAGIARPERFFDRLPALGLDVRGVRAFRDHHRFSRKEVDGVIAQARAAGATALVTTEKDAVRLEPFGPFSLDLFVIPLRVDVQPAERFAAWLSHELDRSR